MSFSPTPTNDISTNDVFCHQSWSVICLRKYWGILNCRTQSVKKPKLEYFCFVESIKKAHIWKINRRYITIAPACTRIGSYFPSSNNTFLDRNKGAWVRPIRIEPMLTNTNSN